MLTHRDASSAHSSCRGGLTEDRRRGVWTPGLTQPRLRSDLEHVNSSDVGKIAALNSVHNYWEVNYGRPRTKNTIVTVYIMKGVRKNILGRVSDANYLRCWSHLPTQAGHPPLPWAWPCDFRVPTVPESTARSSWKAASGGTRSHHSRLSTGGPGWGGLSAPHRL